MINVIADRYAQALFEVGEETQTTSELYQDCLLYTSPSPRDA